MSEEGKKHYFQAQQPYDRNALDSHHAYLEEYKALHSIYNSNDASLDSVAKSLYPSFNEHFGDVYDDDQAIAYDQLTVEELERGINFALPKILTRPVNAFKLIRYFLWKELS